MEKDILPIITFFMGLIGFIIMIIYFNRKRLLRRKSQTEEVFLEIRNNIKTDRNKFRKEAIEYYQKQVKLPKRKYNLIHKDSWISKKPIPLNKIKLIKHESNEKELIEIESERLLPKKGEKRSYENYSQAIEKLDKPNVFENRVQYRLLDYKIENGIPIFIYDENPSKYFEKINYGGILTYELAFYLKKYENNQKGLYYNMRIRNLIGDPINSFNKIKILTGISTLTLIKYENETRFIMHQRGKKKVAYAMGTFHVIPAGEFQPSSISPKSIKQDFNFQKNILREYAEEVGLMEEHDGSTGIPFDYNRTPFSIFKKEIENHNVNFYFLGFALDPLSLQGEIMTMAIFKNDSFQRLFPTIEKRNNEGEIVTQMDKWGIPFNKEEIKEFLDSKGTLVTGKTMLEIVNENYDSIMEL